MNVSAPRCLGPLILLTFLAFPVQTRAQVQARFAASIRQGCSPVLVNFTDESTGSPNQWHWDLGNGTYSTRQHPSVTYFLPGTYTVKLIVRGASGADSLIRQQYIRVYEAPKIDFSTSDTLICRNATVVFTEQVQPGSGSTAALLWDFGDGIVQSGSHPAHRYTESGQFSVMLRVANSMGCVATILKTGLMRIKSVKAAFSSAVAGACASTDLSFTSNSTGEGIANYSWNWGDGETDTGMLATHRYLRGGTYTVTHVVQSTMGCTDTLSRQIKVSDRPRAAFTASRTQVCGVPGTVRFTAESLVNCTYSWDFGTLGKSVYGSPSVLYRDTGHYPVKLLVKNQYGCADSVAFQQYIHVNRTEIRMQGLPDSGCTGLQKQFSATVSSNDSIAAWQWQFGDGAVSASASPEHQYSLPGNYPVRLKISTRNGCVDSFTIKDAVRIRTRPHAAFRADRTQLCGQQPAIFSNLSTGTVTSWLWDFGDHLLDFSRSPLHLYSDTGWMHVTLIAGNGGCLDTASYPYYLYVQPAVARFSIEKNCSDPAEVSFINLSLGATRWEWDLGDGSRSREFSPRHRYSREGWYEIALYVWNDSTGCQQVKRRSLLISTDHPWFRIEQNQYCLGDTARFTAGTTGNGIGLYSWYFGDDSVACTTNGVAAYRYPQAGSYTVKLVTLDSFNCPDTLYLPAPVQVTRVNARFAPGSLFVCKGTEMSLLDASAASDGSMIRKWHWTYGEGQTQTDTAPPFRHVYMRGGEYRPSLIAESEWGCRDTFILPVALAVKDLQLSIRLTDTLVCPGFQARMQTPYFETGAQFTWYFGDGETGSGQKAAHRYPAEGSYTVTLVVHSPEGCTDSARTPVPLQIRQTRAAFRVSDTFRICPPLLARFSNESFAPLGCNWMFGDGSGTTETQPAHFYTQPGDYPATLVAYGPLGCNDTAVHPIQVKGPSGSLLYTPLSSCRPYTHELRIQARNTARFIWDLDNGVTIPGEDSVLFYTYPEAGRFLPRIILEDSSGCRVPVSGRDSLMNIEAAAAIRVSDTLVCAGEALQLYNSSQSNDLLVASVWSLGDGNSLQAKDTAYTYTRPGRYALQLSITTAAGCSSVSNPVMVQVAEQPVFRLSVPDSGCAPLSVQYQVDAPADAAGWQWAWQWPEGQPLLQMIPPPRLLETPGIYPVTVTATNANGCSYTQISETRVLSTPALRIIGRRSLCSGEESVLEATGAHAYQWLPDSTLKPQETNAAIARIRPFGNHTYRVRGSNATGCHTTDTAQILVHPPVRLRYPERVSLCEGGQRIVELSGADQYSWFPSTGLSHPLSGKTLVYPAQSTRYRVTGTDAAGCFRDTAYVDVQVIGNPRVDAGPDRQVLSGQELQLDARYSRDVTEVFWSPTEGASRNNPGSIIVQPRVTTRFTVEVRNEAGCTAKDEMWVKVSCSAENIFMPNLFSPNGDGINDVFYPRAATQLRIRMLRIYSRWGEQIFERLNFEANLPEQGWDGRFKGHALPPDTFVYIMEVECGNGSVIPVNGNLTLAR